MKYPKKILLVVAFLLAGLSLKADTSFTGTGWLSAVPMPGLTVTNSSGQVFLKGNVHVVRVLASDARMTGRLYAWMDLAYQSDGTATLRVLDRAAPNIVLYQKSFLDPKPILEGRIFVLGVEPKTDQPTSAPSATFDNLVRQTYASPLVSIERAVRITWPDTGMNYILEGAPSVEGPYLPIPVSDPPGIKSITVPVNDRRQFFRAQ